MSRSLAACLILALTQACHAQADTGPAPGFVHIEGKHFIAADGSEFVIKGVSLGNWLMPEGYMFKFGRMRSPTEIHQVFTRLLGPNGAAQFWTEFRDDYITEADIKLIKAAGFNTIRVPLHYALFVAPLDPTHPEDPPKFEGDGYRLIDRLLGWCRDAGLKVILDLHAAPGGQTGVNHDDGVGYPLVFYVPADRQLTIALWRHLAERYRDETTVLGYDLLNEPISPYHDEAFLNRRLEPLYQDIVSAIREVDHNHVEFLAGSQWSTSFSVFGPPFAKNIAYTYHKFWADPQPYEVQEYVDFSNRYDVPILLGETGELNDGWNRAFRTLNERFGIGWCFWTYKNLDSHSTVVSITEPDGWDAFKRLGDTTPDDTSVWDSKDLPSREDATRVVNAYLHGMAPQNAYINASYLASLGLKVP